MKITETQFILKDGRKAVLRSPAVEDAAELLDFIIQASGETEFLMTYPEEYDNFTGEQEAALIKEINDDPNRVMIGCFVDGKLAGNCQLSFMSKIKTRHRGEIAIGLLKDYWNLGIGTRLFEEMFRLAKERGGIRQLELDFMKTNTRAKALYEKMGFRITGEKPNAMQLKGGRFIDECYMVREL